MPCGNKTMSLENRQVRKVLRAVIATEKLPYSKPSDFVWDDDKQKGNKKDAYVELKGKKQEAERK